MGTAKDSSDIWFRGFGQPCKDHCGNDLLTLGVLHAQSKAGVRVNGYGAGNLYPPLSINGLRRILTMPSCH